VTGPPTEPIAAYLRTLVGPGQIFEVRVPKAKPNGRVLTIAGWYDFEHIDGAAADIAKLDARGIAPGIYVTLNPVDEALHSLAYNRLEFGVQATTADTDVTHRRRLLFDIDPVRKAGTSATDGQHSAALERTEAIESWLASRGWPAPQRIDSGNGGQLQYALDLPNDPASLALVKACLAAVALRFDDETVTVDQTVCNAARIAKIPGTVARKADATPDRPHRRASVLSTPDRLEAVPVRLLEELAATVPRPEPRTAHSGVSLDVGDYLSGHNIEVIRDGAWQNGHRWLVVCPFNAEHNDGSAVVLQFVSGAVAFKCQHNSCSSHDWRAVRDLLEPTRPAAAPPPHDDDEAPHGREPGTAAGERSAWGGPQPLVDELRPVPDFDPLVLPAALRPWVQDIADRIQCPPEFAAVAAVIALGTVIGRRCTIMPKQRDDWRVVPNLWGAILGQPGILKSPAADEALAPLRRLQAEAWKRYDLDLKQADFDDEITRARRKAHKTALEKAVARNDDEAIERLRDEARGLEPKEPATPRRFYVNDATTEKLQEVLAANPTGVLLLRDELLGWFRSLDREGHEDARAFYLECWSGLGAFTVDRIGRGTVRVDSTCLSIFGTAQPGPFARYIADAIKGESGADGLAQRFQLVVYPDVSGEWRNVDRWPDTPARQRAWGVFSALAETDLALPDAEGLPFVHFDGAAQEVFDDWRGRLERRLRAGDEHPALLGHLAKYRSLVPSLALIHHLADRAQSGEANMLKSVGADALQAALGWVRYLESHARRIYGMALAEDATAARLIAGKLQTGAIADNFTARDIYNRQWAGLTDREGVETGLQLLEELGWVRTETPPPGARGGRPTVHYRVNPVVLAKVAS